MPSRVAPWASGMVHYETLRPGHRFDTKLAMVVGLGARKAGYHGQCRLLAYRIDRWCTHGPDGFHCRNCGMDRLQAATQDIGTAVCRARAVCFMTTDADQETRMSDELDEVITSFAETYAQMAELLRLLPRTLRRSEEDLARVRATRSCVSKPL
jgi:hypothetical protein